MVVDAILTIVFAPLTWLLEALPSWTPPGWLVDNIACGGPDAPAPVCFAADIGGYIGKGSSWVPVEVLGTVGTALFTVLAISLVVRLVRIVVSALTGGGGSVT